jgi:glycosyltransferase involved in cell wall biosynthesis
LSEAKSTGEVFQRHPASVDGNVWRPSGGRMHREVRFTRPKDAQVTGRRPKTAMKATGDMKNENEPLVSIGMPVYNGEAFVKEALDSVLNQSLADFELIIFDNASTDSTAQICRAYANRDARIHYHRNAYNIGAHPNYNRTYHAARGRYFKWAAHDDVLHPDFLKACVEALERVPEAVVCQSFLNYIDGLGRPIGTYDSNLEGADALDPAIRFAALVLRPHPCYEVMGLFRRAALGGSLLLQSFHGADRALLAEMALRGRFVQVRQPLLVVRDHKDRYTRAQTRPKDRAIWHDTALSGKASFPTWRLYSEYCTMVKRSLPPGRLRNRCWVVLMRWWLHNYNAARMAVDLVAGVFPNFVEKAERFKQSAFRPAPGADEIRSQPMTPSDAKRS